MVQLPVDVASFKFIRRPKTVGDYAYNLAIYYKLEWRVQRTIEEMLDVMHTQYNMPLHIAEQQVKGLIFQMTREPRKKVKPDENSE